MVPMAAALHVLVGAWPPPDGTTLLLPQKVMAPVVWLTVIMPNWVCAEM
jgi:hypothetical protein